MEEIRFTNILDFAIYRWTDGFNNAALKSVHEEVMTAFLLIASGELRLHEDNDMIVSEFFSSVACPTGDLGKSSSLSFTPCTLSVISVIIKA